MTPDEPRKLRDMSDREQQVYYALLDYIGGVTPTIMARVMNLDSPCKWCPVLPPKPGERCAVVPRSSAAKVERVLESLLAMCKIEVHQHRHKLYAKKKTN